MIFENCISNNRGPHPTHLDMDLKPRRLTQTSFFVIEQIGTETEWLKYTLISREHVKLNLFSLFRTLEYPHMSRWTIAIIERGVGSWRRERYT